MRNYLAIIICLILFSCNSNQDGYSSLDDDVSVRLEAFGDGESVLANSTYYELGIQINSIGNQTCTHQGIYRNLKADAFDSEAWFGDFMSRAEGDSILYKLSCPTLLESIFMTDPNFKCEGAESFATISFSILKTWTDEEYKEMLRNSSFSSPAEDFQFLKSQVPFMPEADSLIQKGEVFIRWVMRGSGAQVAKDSLVRLHYKGFLLDESYFDQSPLDSGLVFRIGEQGQVLPGIEKAVNQCRFGDSIIVYMPSYLGFGSRGSTNGAVPPYSALGYALKIDSIQ